MAKIERDSKGRFVKGVVPEGSTPFSAGVAQEMQLRSVAARKANKTLREAMLEALAEQAPGSNGLTKLEVLVRKAMDNHVKGKLSFLDLKSLSSVLGEDHLKVETDGPQVIVVSQQSIEAAKKWSK